MNSSRRLAAGLLLALLSTLAPASARAAPDPAKQARARAFFKRGEAAYAARRYEQALGLYLKAYEMRQLNGFHFNIGLCYRKLGRYSKAISHLTSYIEGSSSPAHRRRARRLIKSCEDDQKAGRPGEAQQLRALQPKGASEPPRRLQIDPTRGADGDGADRRSTDDADADDDRRDRDDRVRRRTGWHPAVFFTGLGLTVALVGAGSITGALALDKSARFKDLSTRAEDLQALSDSGKMMKLISTISFIAAGAVAAGTLAAFIATDFSSKSSSDVGGNVSAAPLPRGGLLVSYGARF